MKNGHAARRSSPAGGDVLYFSKRKTALVTGAAGGIGRELCRQFAMHGYNLVVSDVERAPLQKLAGSLNRIYGVRVAVAVTDLAREDGPERLYAKIRRARIQIDVLVNNAGFGLGGYFHRNDPRLQADMIRVNLIAPTKLCRLFGAEMAARGGGAILNTASLGSFVAGPMNAVYCATKAYVLSLSEALAEELSGKGVQVTAFCPGGTHTGFARRAGMENTLLFNVGVLDPAYVAQRAFEAYSAGRRVAVVGVPAQVMTAALRFVPRVFGVKVSHAAQAPLSRTRMRVLRHVLRRA